MVQALMVRKDHASAVVDVSFKSIGQEFASGSMPRIILRSSCRRQFFAMPSTIFNSSCPLQYVLRHALNAAPYPRHNVMVQALMIHKDHVSAVMDVSFSPTGQEFASGSYDRTVRVFPHRAGRSREVYHTKRMQRVFCVNFSADAR